MSSAHHADLDLVLAKDNVALPEGAGATLWRALAGLGVLLTVVTVVGAFAGDVKAAKTALHALHAGFLAALGFPLGAMCLVMLLHQTNAGWSATVRRQFENMMSLVWVAALMFVGIVVLQALLGQRGELSKDSAFLWNWMNSVYVEGDPLYEHKRPFLNVPLFFVRAIVYFGVWIALAWTLNQYSTRQDADGDRWHTARARKVSAVGLLLFAFTVAFAAFDWLMTLDFHWFSTMLGVYFFAGVMVGALALGALTFVALRSVGRLHVAFTDEHLHDLSKLLFAFVVFWAYITFSQYFLIWYANIPEETMFFQIRKEGPWTWMSWALPIGHFILPFLILLPRPFRRSRAVIGVMAVYLIVVHLMDVFWMVRPEVKGVGPGAWVDFTGVLGPVLIMIGLYVRKVVSGPLVPLNDPRLPEALSHRNNV